MAVTQLFGTNYEYCSVDNAAAQSTKTAPVSNCNAEIGYDTVSVVPNFGAAVGQDKNTYTNGTVPDFVASGATTVLNSAKTTRLLFKNPS